MKIRLQKSLALILTFSLHVLVLRPLLAPEADLGKNIPVIAYVARTHVVSVPPSPENRPSHPRQDQSSSARTTADLEPASAMPEGRLERDDKIYLDIRQKYFKSNELDARPMVTTPLELGVESVNPTTEGEATVRFFVNEYGSVDWMEVEENSLPESMLEQLHAQQKLLHFTPGRKAGLDVKSIIVFKIKLAREPNNLLPDSASIPPLKSSK
ncbi:MAG: hypothetical protein V4447_16570 [Pseudomonadota bacterium]